MSIADICALDVKSIAHDDSVLWLWTTNHHLREAFAVLDAWGFQQRQILTWVKDKMGRGDWLRGQTEHALMAVRGEPVVTLTNQTTALHAPTREHSRKPEEFYALVESLCPAPRYCELFSRQQRERWDGHGDEAPGAVTPEAADPGDEIPPARTDPIRKGWSRERHRRFREHKRKHHRRNQAPAAESPPPDPGEMPDIPDFLRRPLPQERAP